ncbi:MAG TPA: sigma-70 family RNA polymerase sigma factor [Polyangiaceae bacterium]|jgi:RNA polymerase sigma-70 factor (ECF subfamily)|nr:sigma-70 family RNA polymerase sigma factor [Polyangiaceae bacterium]
MNQSEPRSANSDAGAPFTGWVGRLAVTHTPLLSRVARREGLTATDAVDAVQESLLTFLLLPQARLLVDDVDDSAKLLTVLVRNAARNQRRRHFRSKPHVELSETSIIHTSPGVDELLVRAEEHVRLTGCISNLADVQRSVVTLRMLEGLSAEEVASSLGLTTGNVGVMLFRAKKALERCIQG